MTDISTAIQTWASKHEDVIVSSTNPGYVGKFPSTLHATRLETKTDKTNIDKSLSNIFNGLASMLMGNELPARVKDDIKILHMTDDMLIVELGKTPDELIQVTKVEYKAENNRKSRYIFLYSLLTSLNIVSEKAGVRSGFLSNIVNQDTVSAQAAPTEPTIGDLYK